MKNMIDTVAQEITHVLSSVDETQALLLSEKMNKSKRIFMSGEGRSGLMGKALAMRLMHGGFEVYVVGETITPNIEKDDLLIAISGSGSTASLLQFTTQAKEVGADVFLVTTNSDSKIAAISDGILVVPAATKKRRPEEPKTIQPLGNQFDQSVHLLLDAILIYTIQRGADSGSKYEEMTQRHSNLE